MKVYVVNSTTDEGLFSNLIFGVFDTLEKATEIKEKISRNFQEHDEKYKVDILELAMNEPTDDYDWFMAN